MRTWVTIVCVLCATPALAQTKMIVGNTLIDVPPGIVLADARSGHGKGHGRGGGTPAPSPGPAVSAPAPAISGPASDPGRGEASFQTVPGGSVIIPPVAQARPVPGPDLVRFRADSPCPECGTERIITVPVQLHLRAATQIGAIQTQSIAPRGSCP